MGYRLDQIIHNTYNTYNTCVVAAMLSNLQRALHLLQQVQHISTVKQAQRQLQQLSTDSHFLLCLDNIIRNPSIEENTRRMAAVYINRFILDQYTTMEEDLIMYALFNICFDFGVLAKHKSALEKGITLMLEWSQGGGGYLTKFTDAIRTLCCHLAGNGDVMQHETQYLIKLPTTGEGQLLQGVKTMCILSKCVIYSNCHDYEPIFRLIRDLAKMSLMIVPLEVDGEYISAHEEILRLWVHIFESLSTVDPQKQILYKQLFTCTDFQQYIFKIYHLGCREDALTYLEIANPSMQGIRTLMKAKHQAAICNQIYIISLVHQLIIAPAMLNGCVPVLLDLYGNVHHVIYTLKLFVDHREFYRQICEDFIVEMLVVLIRCCEGKNKKDFKDKLGVFLTSIVLPLLVADEEERVMFDEDMDEFIRLAQDCCDHQQMGILKTQAARFLELIGDEDQQSARVAIQLCINSLKAQMMGDRQMGQLQVQLQVQLQLQLQVSHPSQHLPIETCFLILSVFSYQLSKYPQQMQELMIVMNNPLMLMQPALELSRVFLFLAYNYATVYPNLTQGEPWITLALQTDTLHPTTQVSALDFIANVADEYFSEGFILKVAQRIPLGGYNIGGYNHNHNHNQPQHRSSILATTSKLISSHCTKMSQYCLCQIVDRLFIRISQQLQLYLSKKKSHTLQIATSLGILRKILQSRSSLKPNPNSLLHGKIWQIVKQFNQMAAVHMDNQVMRIINEFLACQEFITDDEYYELLPTFIDYFRQPKSHFPTSYFIVFNQFIMKGIFGKVEEKGLISGLMVTFKELVDGYTTVGVKMGNEKIALAHCMLLFQNLLAIYQSQQVIPHQMVYHLGNIAIKLLPSDDQPQLIVDRGILARALNLLLLCHMHVEDERTLKSLLLFYEEKIFKGYDCRVLILCLSNQLFREKDPTVIPEILNIMTKVIAQEKQEMETSLKGTGTGTGTGIKNGTVTGSTSTSRNQHQTRPQHLSQSTKIKIKRFQDYQQILKCIKTPFQQKIDLEEQLKEVLTKMKQNNRSLYMAIIGKLPHSIRERLGNATTRTIIDGKPRNIIHITGVKNGGGMGMGMEQNRNCHLLSTTANKRLLPIALEEDDNEDLEQEDEYHKACVQKKKNKKEGSH